MDYLLNPRVGFLIYGGGGGKQASLYPFLPFIAEFYSRMEGLGVQDTTKKGRYSKVAIVAVVPLRVV